MDDQVAELSPRMLAGASELAEEPVLFNYDPMTKRETLELVRCYYTIPDRRLAKKLLDLVKAMASSTENEDDKK